MSESVGTKEQKLFIPGPQGQLEAIFQPSKTLTSEINDETNETNFATHQHSFSPIIGVICHPHPLHQGTMNNKVVTTIAKSWQQMGLATLRFNFRGVGLSEGKYGEGQGEVEDLESVLQWLLNLYPNTRFWLGGFSFGAYISAEVATQEKSSKYLSLKSLTSPYPINALLSIAPPLRFFKFAEEKLPEAPWIIIHGEQDELVPYPEVLAWYQRLHQKKSDVQLISFKETTHFFHGRLVELKSEIIRVMEPLLHTV